MKIGEQVQYFAELKGLGKADAKAQTHEILTSLDLGDRLGDSLEALSHGNQQRVQLAVALVHDPDLLILDEPFIDLDPVAMDVLQDVLRDRVASGAAVLFSSHQLDLVEQLCDDIVVIADGTIRATGMVRDVRRSTNQQIATVEVASPTAPLDSVMGHLHVLDNRLEPDGRQVIRLSLTSTSELGAVVAAARQVGDLLSLTYEPPTLSEIFKEIVQ